MCYHQCTRTCQGSVGGFCQNIHISIILLSHDIGLLENLIMITNPNVLFQLLLISEIQITLGNAKNFSPLLVCLPSSCISLSYKFLCRKRMGSYTTLKKEPFWSILRLSIRSEALNRCAALHEQSSIQLAIQLCFSAASTG